MTLRQELELHAKTLDRLTTTGYSGHIEDQLAELQEQVGALIECMQLIIDLAEDAAETRDELSQINKS